MKYLLQFGVIAGVSFGGEVLHTLLPLPIPASVYGLVLLFTLLMLRIVKVEQVEETSDFFLLIMPLLILSPSVSIITSFDVMKGNVILLCLIIALSTISAMAVTGLVSQAVIRIRERKQGGGEK